MFSLGVDVEEEQEGGVMWVAAVDEGSVMVGLDFWTVVALALVLALVLALALDALKAARRERARLEAEGPRRLPWAEECLRRYPMGAFGVLSGAPRIRHIPWVDFCFRFPLDAEGAEGAEAGVDDEKSMVNAVDDTVDDSDDDDDDVGGMEEDEDAAAARLAASRALRLRSQALTAERREEREPKVESSIRLKGLSSATSRRETTMDLPTWRQMAGEYTAAEREGRGGERGRMEDLEEEEEEEAADSKASVLAAGARPLESEPEW